MGINSGRRGEGSVKVAEGVDEDTISNFTNLAITVSITKLILIENTRGMEFISAQTLIQ